MRILMTMFWVLSLAACGGGGGNSACDTCQIGSSIPVGSISGVTFDGLINGGTVHVYDYSSGAKGALLAQATSDMSGRYSVSLQVETRPILLEMTGGNYIEEAGAAQVSLGAGYKLSAVANYTTGSSIQVSITSFTHLAAGLAAYEISQGKAVSTAINDANIRTSNLVGADVIATAPREITDVGNASATLTSELKYGFLLGAISDWTHTHAPNPSSVHVLPYTSIDFAQLLYRDVAADGLLDGNGRDNFGKPVQLSFGAVPLSVNSYRNDLGISLVKIAASPNNKTSLTGAQILTFAKTYIANTDAMFNGVAVSPIAQPSVTISAPLFMPTTWLKGMVSVTAITQTDIGLSAVELLVDDVVVATATNLAAPSFVIDSSKYSDATHTIAVRAVDLGGQVAISSVQVNTDNTPPTSTVVIPPGNGTNVVPLSGCAVDNGSGILSVTDAAYGTALALSPQGCWGSTHYLFNATPATAIYPIIVKNKVGLCSTYNADVWYGVVTLVSQGPC